MKGRIKETADLERQNLDLKQQIELKDRQIEDLEFSLNALKKQQSIWQHLNQGKSNENEFQGEISACKEQNQKLKSQLLALLNEKQFQENQIQQLREKVNDLKYTNQELKKINEKSNEVYEKEILIIKSEKAYSQQTVTLRKQKEKLQNTLKQCEKIAKEMEEFYMHEIHSLSNAQEEQKQKIQSLTSEKGALEEQLEGKEKRINQLQKIEKNEYKMKENVVQELIKAQNHEKRWELMLQQLKERYQRQIAQLKDKIKFLIVKLESLQDSKYYNEGNPVSTFNDINITNSVMTQSKIAMSSATSQSFRFTPNNSFSSSIKESLSRRDTNSMKTPNKYNRNSKNLSKYLEHVNV